MDSSETQIRFDPQYHAYWWGDQVIPSVTQQLDDSGYITDFCKSQSHADRGTDIHRMVNLEIMRLIDGRTVKGALKSELASLKDIYPEEFNQFTEFHQEMGLQFISSEEIVHGSLFLTPGPYKPDWAGMLDFLAKIRKTGKLVMGDIKTGKNPPPHTPVQLAAYVMAKFPLGYEDIGRFAVKLHKDRKKYGTKSYDDPEDFNQWIETVKRFKRNNPNY